MAGSLYIACHSAGCQELLCIYAAMICILRSGACEDLLLGAANRYPRLICSLSSPSCCSAGSSDAFQLAESKLEEDQSHSCPTSTARRRRRGEKSCQPSKSFLPSWQCVRVQVNTHTQVILKVGFRWCRGMYHP